MSYLHALILGIVEGVTEFLPVSSTAHMILTSHVLGLEDNEFVKSFEIIIQLGRILAVVALYWRRLLDRDLFVKTAVAFVPTGLIGLTVYKAVKGYLLGNVTVVLVALLVGGVGAPRLRPPRRAARGRRRAGLLADHLRPRARHRALPVARDGPGVSRSAATIVGGSLMGVTKRTIVEFSFLLAIPTMAAGDRPRAAQGVQDARRQLRRARRGLRGELRRRPPRDQVVPRLHQEPQLRGVRVVPHRPRGPVLRGVPALTWPVRGAAEERA
jgi:undecaprenyl-diphosphatase